MQITTKIIAVSVGAMVLVGAGSAAFAVTREGPAITREQAVKIAQTEVPGARVTDVDYEHRWGRRPAHWDIELKTGSTEHDVEIHATTGKILDHDVETDD